jgi:hypothetical protein
LSREKDVFERLLYFKGFERLVGWVVCGMNSPNSSFEFYSFAFSS